ncbi:MAG: response regulator [Thermoplasmatota archaeon]
MNPDANPDAHNSLPSASPPATAAWRDVLVVDDVKEITEFVARLVRHARGVQVNLTTETDPAKARDLVGMQRFDVIISDFRMPNVDGVEVLRAGKKFNPEGRRILMTGYNEIPASMERLREADIDAYIQKPLRSQDLLLLLLDFMNGNEQVIRACRSQARELELMAQREETAAGGPSVPGPAASN